MAFSLTTPPKRAGDYSRFVSQRRATIAPSPGRTVFLPIVDDSGPIDTVVELDSFADYLAVYGVPLSIAAPSPGYIAVYNAFRGQADGSPGAGTVLCYRMASASAHKASLALKSGAGATTAITINARFEGVRGNNYRAEVVVNAVTPATLMDLNIYDGITLIDQYRGYGSADMVALQTEINRRAGLGTGVLQATGAVNGTKLDALTAANLTTGDSGQTLLAADWTDAMTKAEPQQFAYFVPYDLTDSSIQTAMVTWAISKNSAEKSKRFFLVEGGGASDTYTTALARTVAANNENVVNLGIGTYTDTSLGLTLTTSQLAPRLAGILSNLPGTSSLTFADLQDLVVATGAPTELELTNAIDDGIVTISLGASGLHFEKGMSTYSYNANKTNTSKDVETYRRIKCVTTMHRLERTFRDRRENGSGRQIGRRVVNEDTREALVADGQAVLDQFIVAGELQAGALCVLSAEQPGTDDDEFVGLDYIGKFGRSLEQVRNSLFLG